MAIAMRLVAGPALVLALAGAGDAADSRQRVLLFGDSLTWGWKPNARMAPERHPPEDRWPNALARALGNGFTVLMAAEPGMTTDADDPNAPGLNGLRDLEGALARVAPVDLVVVMVGTNDTKRYFDRSPEEIAEGARALLEAVAAEAPEAERMLVSPPAVAEAVHPAAAAVFEGAREKGLSLPDLYRQVAEAEGAAFLDAGAVVEASATDGIHLTAEADAALGEAVAEAVRAVLAR